MLIYRGRTSFEEALIQDVEQRERPDFRAELLRVQREEIARMKRELAMDTRLRADSKQPCGACGGPLRTGDRIVMMPGKMASDPSEAWHRSCLLIGGRRCLETSKLRRAHQKRLEREREADQRQGLLFGGSR